MSRSAILLGGLASLLFSAPVLARDYFPSLLSPDGQRVAYVEARAGANYLWVARTTSPGERSAITVWDETVSAMEWSADGLNLVIQRDNGEKKFSLLAFPTDHSSDAVLTLSGDSSKLRQFGMSSSGVVFALVESDAGGLEIDRYRPDCKCREVKALDAVDTIMSLEGDVLAYQQKGTANWLSTSLADSPQLIAGRPLFVSASEVVAASTREPTQQANEGDTFVAWRTLKPNWIGTAPRYDWDLKLLASRGFDNANRIQVADKGRVWLLDMGPGHPRHDRIAVYFADSAKIMPIGE